jgi:hypothetical protein
MAADGLDLPSVSLNTARFPFFALLRHQFADGHHCHHLGSRYKQNFEADVHQRNTANHAR